jgi:small subunit ribosomal protein S2
MNRIPEALVVVDPHREHIAVKEAKKMGVVTVALIDTDSDPDTVDLPIPGNDDSIRSIEIVVSRLAESIREGRASAPPEALAQASPKGELPQERDGRERDRDRGPRRGGRRPSGGGDRGGDRDRERRESSSPAETTPVAVAE